MTIMVTGGCGFIGSNFVIDWLEKNNEMVINIDKLTYAGNLNNLSKVKKNINHIFFKKDISDNVYISKLLNQYKPRFIINFAAESHVDRSIDSPEAFIQTNILGTFHLLETAKSYWNMLDNEKKTNFRFLHISTDEVYGALELNDAPFNEDHNYSPNSPYSASKASSDHLVRSYFKTYNFPTLITNCSNNYGPFQFPEKLIPLTIHNALKGANIPIYGDGQQVRDWLYVLDHCNALSLVLKNGKIGETYNIGGLNEKTNLEVVSTLCFILDKLRPNKFGNSYKSQIKFVNDRPGHDQRYAIDANKIKKILKWAPIENFETGLEKTVKWYLANQNWMSDVTRDEYRLWSKRQYS
ncbi:dTDP-glucose 4,6-dehydratase [Candidatus Pseudothioglobus singularis]|jgi:dTDP-glucose 4,6-dehydratase|nr:dTDP-glucose 4,6-dehydratase [Candidatus Pseudothioglobus singularis]